MEAKEFLTITNTVFGSVDDLLIFFLNELNKEDRTLMYGSLPSMNDEVISNYHDLIKIIYEESEDSALDKYNDIFEQRKSVKKYISTYQDMLENILLLVKNIKVHLQPDHMELYEDTVDYDIDELIMRLSAYIKN